MCKKLTALIIAFCMTLCMLTVPVMAAPAGGSAGGGVSGIIAGEGASVGDPTADFINGLLYAYFNPDNPYGQGRLAEQLAILEDMRANFDNVSDDVWTTWAAGIIDDAGEKLWTDIENEETGTYSAGVIHRYFLLEAIYLRNTDGDTSNDFELTGTPSSELEAGFEKAMEEMDLIFTHSGRRDYNDLWGYSFEECLDPFNRLENDASNLYIYLFGDGYEPYHEAGYDQDYFKNGSDDEYLKAFRPAYANKPSVSEVKALFTAKLAKLIKDACCVFYTSPSTYVSDVEEMIGTENRKVLGIVFGKHIFDTFSNSGEGGFDEGLLDGYVQNFKEAVTKEAFAKITSDFSNVLQGTQREGLDASYALLGEFLNTALDIPVRTNPDPDKPNSFLEVMENAGIDIDVAVDIHKNVGDTIVDTDDSALGRIVAVNLLVGRFMDVYDDELVMVENNGLDITLPYETMQTDRFNIQITASDIADINADYNATALLNVMLEPVSYHAADKSLSRYDSYYSKINVANDALVNFAGTTAYNVVFHTEGHRGDADDDIYSYLRTYRVATGAKKVILNPVKKTIYVNTSFTITHNIDPASSAKWLIWESADPSIAIVDENGKVTGVRVGTTTITAKTQAGDVISECIVTVVKRQGPGGGSGGFISDEDAATIIESAVNNGGLYQPKPAEGEVGTHRAYIKGYPDGLVRPGGYITRAELAMILHRLSDDFNPQGGQQFFSFPDVPHEFWAAIAIYDVNQKGWMTGYPDGTFRPDDYLTRAEFVTALQRATGVVFNTKSTGLTDVAGHWAEKYITTANYYGFVNGYPDMTFRPENEIIRAEAMAIVNRIIGRAPEYNDIVSKAGSLFPDLTEDFWGYADVMEAILYHDFVMGPEYESWQTVHDGYVGY